MQAQAAQPLDYASPPTASGGRRWFRTMLVLFAVGGIVSNLAFVAMLTEHLHRARWVYADLMHDPRAYGRLIDPVTIASLRDLRPLWTACVFFGVAAAVGLLLAVNLLVGASLLNRNPAVAERRLTVYRRLKPLAIAMTLSGLFWASHVNLNYWIAATRHIPPGSGPPAVEAVVLALCALLPWWWVGKRSEPPQAAGANPRPFRSRIGLPACHAGRQRSAGAGDAVFPSVAGYYLS